MAKQKKERPIGLFDDELGNITEWEGMPEYKNRDISSVRQIVVHFLTEEDAQSFAKLLGQKISKRTKYLYYPKAEKRSRIDKNYIDES